MPPQTRHDSPHSTVLRAPLNALIMLGVIVAGAGAQASRPSEGAGLREELVRLVAAAKTEQAIRRAQQALGVNPTDPTVRQEYIDLHLALARTWLTQRRFADCMTALQAIRALDPQQPEPQRLIDELNAARERAGAEFGEIDRLLRLELFDAALERAKETKALRPDLAQTLRESERAAWLGTADDHYLARNFHEAFALYESLLANDPNAPESVRSRWAVSLALALAESDLTTPTDPDISGRLLARTSAVLGKTRQPILGKIISGMLAERAGQLPDAGRAYAEALAVPWELPPADRRRAAVRRLRDQAVARVEELYRDTPVERRDGFWAIVLPDLWKQRQTPHFDVYARNDLIAERLAEAAEYHLAGVSAWLGSAPPDWQPHCEIRVHATREDLHRATGTTGITFALSQTRLQGNRVLLRKLEVFQADPWLLSSTLPHELTHLIIAETRRQAAPPLAIDEGLALETEPPARRLMYRRLLAAEPPAPAPLLAAIGLPADVKQFCAAVGVLTGWLLNELGSHPADDSKPMPVPRLLDTFRNGVPAEWWRPFGFESEAAVNAAWTAWYAARRAPYRMPLMILVEPSPQRQQP